MRLNLHFAAWGRAGQGLYSGGTPSPAPCQGQAHKSRADGAAPDLKTPARPAIQLHHVSKSRRVSLTSVGWPKTQRLGEVSIPNEFSCTYLFFFWLTERVLSKPLHGCVWFCEQKLSTAPRYTQKAMHTPAAFGKSHTWSEVSPKMYGVMSQRVRAVNLHVIYLSISSMQVYYIY